MANAIIANTTFENNTTLLDGSNARGFGGAIAVIGSTNVTIADSTVQDNAAFSGGGIYFTAPTSINNQFAGLTVTNSTIANNTSTTEGGGITQRTGQTAIQRSSIAGNAGGIWWIVDDRLWWRDFNTTISGNDGIAYGTASLTSRDPLLIVNSTITDNGGPYVGGVRSTTTAVQFLNSIVAQNTLTSSEEFRMPFTESDLIGGIRSLGHNIFGEVDNVVIASDRVTGPGPHSTDLFGSVASPANALLGPLAGDYRRADIYTCTAAREPWD